MSISEFGTPTLSESSNRQLFVADSLLQVLGTTEFDAPRIPKNSRQPSVLFDHDAITDADGPGCFDHGIDPGARVGSGADR